MQEEVSVTQEKAVSAGAVVVIQQEQEQQQRQQGGRRQPGARRGGRSARQEGRPLWHRRCGRRAPTPQGEPLILPSSCIFNAFLR